MKWTGTTYGNAWMHKWLIRMLRHMDVRILYAFTSVFVIPVCLLLNPSAGIIYRFFRERMGYGRIKAALGTYTNHCLFGQVVIDRFSMYAGKKFHVEIDGQEYYQKLATRDESFIILSSHVGNYEIAGYTLNQDQKAMNALVFYGEKESVMANRAKLFAGTNVRMIPIRSDMGHLFEIDQALQKGEIVSMPADRIFGSQKNVECQFFGAKAKFPLGAFAMAIQKNVPVLAVFVMKEGMKKYHAYVKAIECNPQSGKREQMAQLAQSYAEQLETIVRCYPTQWFNYFDFWQQ